MFLIHYRWLIKHPGFNFHLKPRDPSCLPKEFPNAGNNTCYFLEDYRHPTLDESLPLIEHIEAAMKTIPKFN